MKFVDFYKSSKQFFSIRKFIKPVHSQEYYNNLHYQRVKDKKNSENAVSSGAVFPMDRPLHPDTKKSSYIYDEHNEHYVYYINKRQRELEERANRHISLAKASLKAKNNKKFFPSKSLKTEDLGLDYEVSIDKDTNLVYGLGFDNLITNNLSSQKSSEDRQLQYLINKLGYVDFRDFVALNKYVLEAKNHDDLVNQTKSRFLQMALQKVNQNQKEELKKNLRKIDEANKDLKVKDKNDLKIDYLLNNYEESKELFYNYYYKLKELNERDDSRTMNEFEKYEKMVKSINNSNLKQNDKDELIFKRKDMKGQGSLKYDLEDYMERIIKNYREQRTIALQTDSDTIIKKLNYLLEKQAKARNFDQTVVMDEIVNLAKYQTFLTKYKKIYIPTNIETERLINKYLRDKRIKEFTFEKMMEEKDPYFSPLSDEEEIINNENIYDEESKKKAMDRHQIKKNYFEAKYQFRKKELEDNIDKQLADEMGIILTKEGHEKPLPEIDEFEQISFNDTKDANMNFIKRFVDDHYKNFKLDFMYNYMDFFSNKYKVRRRIAEEMKRKVSLDEINFILNNLVAKETGKYDINKKTVKYSVHDFVKSQYGVVNPNYIQTLTETRTDNPIADETRRKSVLSAMEDVSKKSLDLDENDKFEVELYKGIKNDPYFKHYLYTNFSNFAETMNDFMAGHPFISRGHKPQDYTRYQNMGSLKNLNMSESQKSSAISENKSEMLNSLESVINNSLSTHIEQTPTNQSFYGKGKRKKAIACAELKPGKGTITVNGRPIYDYFRFSVYRGRVIIPLQLTNTICQYDVKLTVQGGGSTGQADACLPAISKALIKINPEWKPILAKNYCLKHDPRNVEPKKPGKIKARKGYVYNRR